jgi:DNA-binding XRE family transcriptional regulator
MSPDLDLIGLGIRLYKIRFVLGLGTDGDQQKFAARIGVPKGTYNHWETGKGAPQVIQALRIIQQLPGLTLDYIYLGDLGGLRVGLADRLRDAPDERKSSSRTRSRQARLHSEKSSDLSKPLDIPRKR